MTAPDTTDHSPILGTVPLGDQWPTVDPFLFCAHHNDAYPAGDGAMAPAAPLGGRAIGSDFSGLDGWSMYHGSSVPGFPQHPHRGFETVTFCRRGLIDHADSLGATARFGRGDVQWMTAGSGVVHSEMFPLVDTEAGNHTELFQVWLNLPASDKFVDPYFTMLWADDIPTITLEDGATITVIAGELDGVKPPPPPPNSWAARPEADLAIWHIVMPENSSWTLPATHANTQRVLYAFDGGSVSVAGEVHGAGTGVELAADQAVDLVGGADGIELVLLQGRPIAEPVARYGPFVMNTDAEIQQAFDDYNQTGFGGWPWDRDDPVHPSAEGRFAIHADGRRENATSD
ncbi:MAG: pirin family protein [Acidimicrobiales bacterium]